MSWRNFTKSPLTTLGGALLGMLQSAAVSAAATYTQTGNVTDPKPYAVAAAVGAATFVAGGFMADKATLESAAPALQEPAAVASPIIPPEVAAAASQVAFQLLMEKLQPKTEAAKE